MSCLTHITRISLIFGPFFIILTENPPQNEHGSHVCFAFFQGHKLMLISARRLDYKFNSHTLKAFSNELVAKIRVAKPVCGISISCLAHIR